MLKKYPFVKQTGIKDCGVACLQMIIKYYQGYVSTRQLQEMTKTNKNGTTAYHLVEAAKQLGFDAKGIKAQLTDVKKNNMILPCIASVTIDNTYNHYIVIYEIDYKKQKLKIADPAEKIKQISFEDFAKIWNNVFLFMYPIKKIPLYKNDYKPLNFILSITLLNKKILKHIILISIFYSLYSILGSYYFKFISDSLFVNQSKYYLFIVFLLFLLFTSLKQLSDFFRNQLLIYLNERIDLFLTNNIFKSIIFLPYNYYRNHTTGEVTSRLNDLSKVREMISKVVIFIFIDLPLAIVSCVLMYFISKDLFFISMIVFALYFILSAVFIPTFIQRIDRVQQERANYNSYMIEAITGFESVKGRGMEKNVIDKFEGKFIGFLNNMFIFESLYNKQNFLKELISDIGNLVIIFFGSLLIINQTLTFGGLLFFNSLFTYFLFPLKNILELGILFNETKLSIRKVLELIEPINEEGFINKTIDGDIVIKNLDYSYDDRTTILQNINLSIKAGEKVMIVGSSGSGKSTLMKLLFGYYNVSRNKIKIGGIDINDLTMNCLKNNIIYISQKETLFTDTLYNNIDIENNSSYEKFLEIAKLCYVDEIIEKQNVGYYMLIEENGFNLSGGEIQRIVLARSLMKDFQILIIDEGLNQVDISLERKILKNIIEKYQDKTIVVISHRLQNMDLFNHIIEFSNHKIKKDVSCNVGIK